MQILAHRGFWEDPSEKNGARAFRRSFEAGFGIETDLRDHDGELVVSHDPPEGANALAFGDLLALHASIDPALPLALNIKADGLQAPLAKLLSAYAVEEFFVFDMSVPDTLGYLRAGMPTFTRHSEIEPRPALYDQATGVWMDAFEDWISVEAVRTHLAAGKKVCLVSPELHRRDPAPAWARYAADGLGDLDDRVMLCTDHPRRAQEAFDA